MSSSEDRVQWVSTAWINALRDEALRVGRELPEVARVVGIGVWIATYADKDGSNAFPSRETLATLAGCSQETVTRAVKVLLGVGVLMRKRRPNASAVYQLLMPLGRRLDWAAHIHHMTETRQRKAYARKKAEAFAEPTRTASVDAVRTATTDGVPDSVRVGGSEPPTGTPDSVHGRPRKASADAVRTASTDAPTKPTPTFGRDPHTDHTLAGLEPRPQVRAREAAKDESSTGEGPAAAARAALAAVRERPPLARCTEPDCDMPLPPGVTGRCEGCRQYLAITDPERRPA
ncbi:helix-turn-helix domain-containing protein [Streptomyces longwoodensis]|uniref:helix-turn-helix domain-containing protein n=1 Tax=Streptomyces longwoodensis TaxID=68231 RepID=UPI0022553D02|nr:helix-turn-helix domain-containing protein [Streptomyces longwoodensis]MCX4994289.1 helix-turn-helix domain-containing protein [Streptomyces longwoodensis]